MAHRGRFQITQLANSDAPADLCFKREPQQSPRTLPDKAGAKLTFQVNHEQESNKPEASPRSAAHPSFAPLPRNGGLTPNSSQVPALPQQHETPVFPTRSPPRRHASPDLSQVSQLDDSSLVPVSLISLLQTSLCGRFTEMMQLHKEVMGEMAARDRRRDEQLSLLIGQNVELVRTVARLRHEQSHLHSRSK